MAGDLHIASPWGLAWQSSEKGPEEDVSEESVLDSQVEAARLFITWPWESYDSCLTLLVEVATSPSRLKAWIQGGPSEEPNPKSLIHSWASFR